jgi:DNA (cytosine-5)-methyltransferase 1
MATSTIKVVELFAGVGGFRLGLERANARNRKTRFKIVWSNQWEPSTKVQHASEIYTRRFGADHHSNTNIADVPTSEIPDHDVLVGGFPCQDYSVASTLKNSHGLLGKKGVLWWQIHRILEEKKRKPSLLILENVDRLLSSPASQRGKDMAVMLKSLVDIGYSVEWRVVNAADLGMPQRRKRVFIVGYHKSGVISAPELDGAFDKRNSILGLAFSHTVSGLSTVALKGSISRISSEFNQQGSRSPFQNAGFCSANSIVTGRCEFPEPDSKVTLDDILIPMNEVPEEFFIPEDQIQRWQYLKGAKREQRINRNSGHKYAYSEGAMAFPDDRSKPARTIITGEGGRSPSRFKHVVREHSGRYRRLTPVELERLNMFPDNHTEGASNARRAFFMGNALVVGVVELIGRAVIKKWNEK